MSQSLSQIYVHLVYGTKNRFPFLKDDIRNRMHAYKAGTLKKYESPAIVINSVEDHVHILFRLSKNHALSKIVEEIKKQSSKWIKGIEGGSSKFAWQGGYGAFSVSSSKVEVVKQYIEKQREHHKKKSFREEVEDFVKKYDVINYDAKYFWDKD